MEVAVYPGAENQQEVLTRFRATTCFDAFARYEVLLPWKESHPPLQNNRATAERRLENTRKKLINDKLLEDYEKVFDECISEGIIETVPKDELDNVAYYMPHRHVVKEGSTTRIRPVFDASARDKQHPSLNQCLETGPNLIELIPSLILRFREKRVGVIADIRKAFLQISVASKERNVVRFLPFLLGATIERHLEPEIKRTQSEEKEAILRKLKTSFYVDNCVTSVDSVGELECFRETATTAMARGGFDLRGWEHSNDSDDALTTAVLGLTWNKTLDTLQLSDTILVPELPSKITKRTILSVTQRVFDPLGMDTAVGDEVKNEFLQWHHDLPLLREVNIRRWALGEERDSLSLHLFVNASKDAYAAVIYARTASANGVQAAFVEAKSRVAPKERAMIPRLELLAATVGARLLKSVVSSLSRPGIETYCWSDSTIALAWIQREKQWATFVFNRVREIRQLTESRSWRHIPGEQNPADLPSRGCTARQLIDSRWIEGPEWLKLPATRWPDANWDADEEQVDQELPKTVKKKEKIVTPVVEPSHTLSSIERDHEVVSPAWYLKRFSKYDHIVRLVAWIQRFLNNCRRKKGNLDEGELTGRHIDVAESTLLRISQQESFADKRDRRLSSMTIYEDKSGLLSLKTLVENR
ncbi:uncharacterized protein LOC107041872 [Diachasma alloeum]|uniref:uncharacterized protein LOC107041872 n=1 Tax=Diachasma alloeum TaxID=454923 RepID=UPI00073835C6|nr:uncharacterized protein LOC107041872 [Diachasma alloeum]